MWLSVLLFTVGCYHDTCCRYNCLSNEEHREFLPKNNKVMVYLPFSKKKMVKGVLCNSYTMGTRGLPDIYTLGPRVYISDKPLVPMV